MFKLVRLLGGAVAVGVAIVAGVLAWGQFSSSVTLVSAGPTVARLVELSDLVVLRVQVADVLIGDHSAGAEMALLVRGDCDLAIDLSRAEVRDRDDEARTATVILPDPEPTRPRVDHERTRVWRTRKTNWLLWQDPRDVLYAQAMQQAQQLVLFWSSRPEQRQRARRHAERIVSSFYQQLGWQVTVQWQHAQPSARDDADDTFVLADG